MTSKSELRRTIRARLETEEFRQTREQNSLALNSRVLEFLAQQSGIWAAFQPLGYEPDVRPAMQSLKHIDWVFPKIEGAELAFFRPHDDVHSEATYLPAKWGIAEPNASAADRVGLKDIAGFLIPGLAFDKSGNRLGRGRGYYDRTLAKLNDKKQMKIGIAFDQQVSELEIPTESFDQPMDWVLTESHAHNRSQRKSS